MNTYGRPRPAHAQGPGLPHMSRLRAPGARRPGSPPVPPPHLLPLRARRYAASFDQPAHTYPPLTSVTPKLHRSHNPREQQRTHAERQRAAPIRFACWAVRASPPPPILTSLDVPPRQRGVREQATGPQARPFRAGRDKTRKLARGVGFVKPPAAPPPAAMRARSPAGCPRGGRSRHPQAPILTSADGRGCARRSLCGLLARPARRRAARRRCDGGALAGGVSPTLPCLLVGACCAGAAGRPLSGAGRARPMRRRAPLYHQPHPTHQPPSARLVAHPARATCHCRPARRARAPCYARPRRAAKSEHARRAGSKLHQSQHTMQPRRPHSLD
ncbi:MAG: hypothetical protein J3K34DRAFT_126165 [Monoraphidium minutum]|nr:MAG: hypothetical protein J3K34DRAFT_126165 [Monoraphidium minutum]